MRLIRVSDYQLVDFPFDAPPYAILSHTWGPPEDEVLYQDMTDNPTTAKVKPAFKKIQYACQQAQSASLEYCWVDTCCIDKKSSAELQEAINSMFSWYQNSEICYVYLQDVRNSNHDDESFENEFKLARWFTRGWTLQELIAPARVDFYSTNWQYIGSKRESLAKMLTSITGISKYILAGTHSHSSASVAERMSWASQRQTSRSEDLAYCLLGLFSITMPMLYGEGEHAFVRLQQEILAKLEDDSIFAWTDRSWNTSDDALGMLAQHPRQFVDSGGFIGHIPTDFGTDEDPPIMTSRGLKLRKMLFQLVGNIYIMPINCMMRSASTVYEKHPSVRMDGSMSFGPRFTIGIVLAATSGLGLHYPIRCYNRIHPARLFTVPPHARGVRETIFISQSRKSLPGYLHENGDDISRRFPINRNLSSQTYSLEAAGYSPGRIDPEPLCMMDFTVKNWFTIGWTVSEDVPSIQRSLLFRVGSKAKAKIHLEIRTLATDHHGPYGRFGIHLRPRRHGQYSPPDAAVIAMVRISKPVENSSSQASFPESYPHDGYGWWKVEEHYLRVFFEFYEAGNQSSAPHATFVIRAYREDVEKDLNLYSS